MSLCERNLASVIRAALREAHANEWEFAKIPCCVLRDLHDFITHAEREGRYANEPRSARGVHPPRSVMRVG